MTGGTGFVGSHTVAAVHDRGHDVRMLVRSPDRVAPALAPHGLDADHVEVVEADLTDDDAIATGLDGCDAVIHVASVFSFDPARSAEMARSNLAGMRVVVDAAIAHDLDPIVHVSSYAALLQDGSMEHGVGPDAPVGDSPYPYCRSKADQERVAREYQDAGRPVVIVHPGAVWGPHDPYDGESVRAARSAARGRLVVAPGGGIPIADVRDVAATLAATLEAGRGPRRYSAVGTFVPMTWTASTVSASAGRRLPSFALPDGAARGMERALATLNRRGRGAALPTAEQLWMARHTVVPDNSGTETELGVRFRPPAETIRDQVAWMREAGRL